MTMRPIVSYPKVLRERAIREKKWLVTISVNGKHLKDQSIAIQGVYELVDAKRVAAMAAELFVRPKKDTQ